MSTRECYYCKDPSHILCKCPVRLNIQQLTIKQQKELIEDLYMLGKEYAQKKKLSIEKLQKILEEYVNKYVNTI